MDKGNRLRGLAYNTSILLIGNVTSKIANAGAFFWLATRIDLAFIGNIELVVTAISLIVPVFTLNVSEYVFRFGEEDEEQNRVFFTSIFLLFLGTTAFIIVVFLVPSTWFLFIPEFLIIGLFFAFAILDIAKQICRAQKDFVGYCLAEVVYSGALLIFTVITFLAFSTSDAYFYGMIIGAVLGTIVVILRWGNTSGMIFSQKSFLDLRRAVTYAVPLLPNILMWWLIQYANRTFIYTSFGAYEVGVFSLATRFSAIVIMINNVFAKAWQVSTIEVHALEDRLSYYSSALKKYSGCIVWFTSLTVMVLQISSSFGWHKEIVLIMPILLLGAIYQGMASFFGAFYLAHKKTAGAFHTSILAVLVNLAFNFYLVPVIGNIGAAVGMCAAFGTLWIIRVIHITKYEKFFLDIFETSMLHIFILVQTLSAFFLPDFALLQIGCFGGSTFLLYKNLPLEKWLDKAITKI